MDPTTPPGSDAENRAGDSRRSWIRTASRWIPAVKERTGVLALTDQVIVSAANFLTGAVVGRFCTKDDFGLYTLGLGIVAIAIGPQASLITSPYTVFSPRLEASARSAFRGSVLVHQLVLSGIAAVALALIGMGLRMRSVQHEISLLFFVISVLIVLFLLRDFSRRVYFADLDFRAAVYLDSLVSGVQVLGVLSLLYFGYLSAFSSLSCIGIASGIGAVFWIFRSRNRIEFNRYSITKTLRQNWSFGKWLVTSSVVWQIGSNIYPWILTAYHGTAATGVLAACLGVIAISNPVALAVVNIAGPKTAHSYATGGVDSLRKMNAQLIAKFALVLIPFSVVFSIFGSWIAVVIYGDKYSGLGAVISLLSLNLLVTVVAVPVSRSLQAMERADLDFIANCVPISLMLILGLPLVRTFGVTGAAFGIVIGNTGAIAVRWALLWRQLRRGTDGPEGGFAAG